ncbi:LytR family transcriptional regulator [Tessaracoccus rhinocerotis]|uniref:LytR family transcriptional regulator n=1 Tax=Tessaracoccus rhinocerotis TaxID=1689449 RepID=A0A553JZF6_9ACTN|nr:LytR C-terminal domain-containing protein [Tessaracoccus rhinocerotis]TRY17829.1 LytR family transcriptional regulator [Tessaracoccus rhinocerotis]
MRIFRLIATPVLLLGLLAFLVWGAFWGWRNLTAPLPTPEPTPCVTVTTDTVTVADVSVRVYNGGFTSGLARRQASRLEDLGFNVIRVGNTDERVSGTVIRGNEVNVPAKRLVMSSFTGATFENDDRVDGTVDVLLGSDFGGETDPETEQIYQVSSGGSVCLPPSPEPTDSPSPSATATTES